HVLTAMAKKSCTVPVGDLSSDTFYCEDVDGKQLIKVKSQSSVDPIDGDIQIPTPSTPSNPPSNPTHGPTHIETYNNGAIIYEYDSGTASWSVSAVLPNDGLKPGDNVSSLTNDANYVSVGDNVSDLANDAGYTTNTGTVTSVGITPTDG